MLPILEQDVLNGSLVKASGLTKKFKDLTAVDGISFEIKSGECFGFLGPNGAGKTTTVKMIHCVSPLTAGTLTVMGIPASVDDRRIKKVTGYISQENNLDTDLTVQENLMIFSEFFNIPRAEAKKRVAELLQLVELENKAKSKVDELSTGMKRRLTVARALLNQPRLLIADEPTTGLDPQARHLIWQRLRQLKSQGVTLILTTQYMEEAEQLCDRIVIMDKGKILREGVPDRLIVEEIGNDVIEIQMSQAKDAWLLDQIKDQLFHHERVGDIFYLYCRDGHSLRQKISGLDLPKVISRQASLEDVFLKLTGRSLGEE